MSSSGSGEVSPFLGCPGNWTAYSGILVQCYPDPQTEGELLARLCNTMERIEGKVWWIHLILALPVCITLVFLILSVLYALITADYSKVGYRSGP
jgi:hypothetical protein